MRDKETIMKRTITKTLLALALLVAAAATQSPVYTASTGAILDPVNVPGLDKPVRVIRGSFTSDVTLTNNFYWVLRGAVFIESGATLTIDAGTRIVGEYATLGTLVIARGGRIYANGTASEPVVFTSDQPVGQRFRADWGGLIINGRAPNDLPGGVGLGEGDTGEYGGDDPNDNSGSLTYVRVEYAGIEFSPDNELNGIAFQSIGKGTRVDYIQVKFNKDDGVEFFGGTVDIKHLLLTSNGDDNMDWTFGWVGRAQYVIIQQRGDDADNGFEGDNNANSQDLLPRSSPTIYNVTLIGDPDTNEGGESDDGMELRAGTAGTIRNFIVMGWKEYGLDISETATITQAQIGALNFGNGIFFNNAVLPGRANLDSDSAKIPAIANNPTILFDQDPGLIDPYNHLEPNFRPASTASLAMTAAAALPPNDGFFDMALYIGALSADPAQDWTQTGWADFSAE